MSLLPIVRLGNPALRTVAQPVNLDRLPQADIQRLIDDMVETMRAVKGVGLAAPQLGASLQLFVYELPAERERRDGSKERQAPIPLRVVVNPMLTQKTGEMVYDWEGCLSIPDLRGLVPRHPAVRVRGHDREGRPLDFVADGFEARIVQHEFDHLNGVVFLDRMRDFKGLSYTEEWERFLAEDSGRAASTPVG
ncbi:MAG TPA: peptide deformylase [Thermoanaerobaculia bacterium]|nr:peptide deformylase [Thermoanaerobaculia bacterium]